MKSGRTIPPRDKFFNNYEAAEDVSWTHGRQTIRFGGEYERDQYNWYFGASRWEWYAVSIPSRTSCWDCRLQSGLCFPRPAIAANPGTSNGSPISNNIFSGGYQAVTPPGGYHHYRTPFADAYIQDDIKVNRRLTVNVGLRWEYHALVYDTGGLTPISDTSLINTVPIPGPRPPQVHSPDLWCLRITICEPGIPGSAGRRRYSEPAQGLQQDNTPLDDFAPRLGFAWSPLANNKLVLRSGGGFFYDREGALNYIGGIEAE